MMDGTADMLRKLAQGMVAQGNLDLTARPRVYNPDGSISTVRSIGVGTDQGEVLLPTVRKDPFHPFGGYIIPEEDAIGDYRRTGQHLGIFDTPENARIYAEQLHQDQARMYGPR